MSLVYAPDGVSTAYLVSELGSELVARGHEVTVLTTTPHFNEDPELRRGQVLSRRWGPVLLESQHGGARVLHAAVPPKRGTVSRLRAYFQYHAVSGLAGLLEARHYDLVLAVSPPLTIGLEGWALARARRVPFVYNVQEIFPDVAVDMGYLRSRPLIRAAEAIERFIYSRATRVTVIGDSFARRLMEKGVPAERITVIPNFVDTDFMAPREGAGAAFRRSQGLTDEFLVLYAGNLGLTQDFASVLDAAERTQAEPAIRWLLVGGGAREAWLRDEVQRRGLLNIRVLTYQPRSTVPDMYAASDVCVVPMKRAGARGTFPSKIYTIMSAGRPAIAAAEPDTELAVTVREAGSGWVVAPETPDALAAAVLDAARDPGGTREAGGRGREYVVRKHSRGVVADAYDRLIRELTDG